MNNNKYSGVSISTFIINLQERSDRLEHIQQQFINRHEFDTKVIIARRHKIGAVGLWQNIVRIVEMAVLNYDDVIIIIQDDHIFTEFYNKESLINNILEANEQGAAILSGGIGGFGHAVPLTENRFWVDSILSTQFIVLYKRIFEEILMYKFRKKDVADLVLSNMTSHKMVMYPFISEQKDFGYSDITAVHNEVVGLVDHMFKKTKLRLMNIQNAYIKFIKSDVDA